MSYFRPFLRAAYIGLVAAAWLYIDSRANAQSAVTFTPPMNVQVRAVLAGVAGEYVTLPCSIAVDIGAPATPGSGSVLVRSIHIVVSQNFSCTVPLQGTPTQVFVSGVFIDGASGAGVSLPAQPGGPGETLFAGTAIAESATGTLNYAAQGFACQSILGAGGQCSGPFNLASPGPNASAVVANGLIAPPAASQTRAVSFQFRGSFPLVSGATWGRIDVLANLSGTIPDGAPACPADFNGANGLSVQDIFDFLAAWFAGNASADFNHTNGIGVQDIFDFLGAWFAGC